MSQNPNNSSVAKTRFTVIPAVYLILRNSQNQVLFGRRANTGFMDGFFGLPSGHVEGQETLKDACVRESLEEIGIEVDPEGLVLKHIAHRFIDLQTERVDFFFELADFAELTSSESQTKSYQGEITNMEPHKCSQLAWLDITNPKVIGYIGTVLQKIKTGENYSDFGFENFTN